MWILVVVYLTNYAVTSNKYEFKTEKACAEVRKTLAHKLIDKFSIVTDCVRDIP